MRKCVNCGYVMGDKKTEEIMEPVKARASGSGKLIVMSIRPTGEYQCKDAAKCERQRNYHQRERQAYDFYSQHLERRPGR